MAEQALWHLKRVTLAVPVPSVATVRARAWMVGPPLLLGLLAALIATQLQSPTWRSEAQVGFSTASDVLGLSFGDPTRFMQVQAGLARSPQLAARVVGAAGVPGISARQFLRHSSAKPVPDADILALAVTYRKRALAVRLANAYATELTRYNNNLVPRSLQHVISRVLSRIKVLRARGQVGSPTLGNLVRELRRLRDVRAQLANRASVLHRARGASSFRPHALRNGLLGGAVGTLLGVALALGVAVRPRKRPSSRRRPL